MADLEAVINAERETSNDTNKPDTSKTPTTSEGQEGPTISSDDGAEVLSDWPPDIGQHIAGNFTDGFYIGEVKEIIDANTVKVSYMEPKKILTAAQDENSRRFWCWPHKEDIHDTNRDCILNLKPCLTLATPPSSKRLYLFACENAEILELMANTVLDEA